MAWRMYLEARRIFVKVFEKVAFHCDMSVSLTLDNVVVCSRPMMVPNAVVCMCYPLSQLLDLR